MEHLVTFLANWRYGLDELHRLDEPVKQAAECSPGRKPGVRTRKNPESPVGAKEIAIDAFCRPLRGLECLRGLVTPGLRPGLFSAARCAGSLTGFISVIYCDELPSKISHQTRAATAP